MTVRIIEGDCTLVLPALATEGTQFDSCVTDPPYHLTSTVERFGKDGAAPAKDGVYGRSSKGFMGKEWDGGDVAFRPETWRAVYDVLKPGAYLLAFGGSRTFHRIACAIEDAGFELRDTIMWIYGTGFPKSHDVSKGIDKAAGATRTEKVGSKLGRPGMAKDGSNQRNGFADAFGGEASGSMSSDILAPATPEAARWSGWGTALKPAFEPIIVARKPLPKGWTVAQNVLAHGTGAMNIDASRIPSSAADQAYMMDRIGGFNATRSIGGDGILGGGEVMDRTTFDPSKGRWPANVIYDGSDEVLEAFAAYGERKAGAATTGNEPSDVAVNSLGKRSRVPSVSHADTGTAARFFYSAKATASDRAGSKHPTVKPLALMRYLATLVTRPGGSILDPFAGSGTTLQAAAAADCGFSATGIEMTPEYAEDIRRRFGLPSPGGLTTKLARLDQAIDKLTKQLRKTP